MNKARELPRGFRNKNPGNIEWGSPWQGLIPRKQATDKRFCQFTDAAYGIRAIAIVLTTYFDKRKAKDGSKIDTIREVIERWAPPIENHTDIYANGIAKILNMSPDDNSLDLHDYDTMKGFVEGIIRHELGNPKTYGRKPTNTVNEWYTSEEIDEGLRRAGFVKPSKPTNKSVVTATGVTGLGAAQLVDMVQPIKHAMDSAHTDISSGDWVRIAFGVATVAVGVYMGYVAYKRHKAGQTA